MSDSPILVAGRALPQTGTVNSPLFMPAKVAQSNIVNAAAGAQTSVYKVKMIANGKTFNMLLPPSIESKHPGRSNPIQLPGLLIKAGIAISKLKIPGFFPIYQHLGVESLTVSLSGMFTGYDGISNLSDAAKWEGWQDLTVKEGQDSYTPACEFYDFAVKNKALIEVNIATSDGSFIPKKSESTTFRDSSSNIKFKGYVKEFELVYVRQDRNYYMIKFEIIDLGTNQCKSAKPATPTTTTPSTNPCKGDALVLEYNKLSTANKNIYKDLLKEKGFLPSNSNPTEAQVGEAIVRANSYYQPTGLSNLLDRLKADKTDFKSSPSFTPSTNFSNSVNNILNSTPVPVTPTSISRNYEIVNDNLGNSPAGLNITKILTKNEGVIKSSDLAPYVTNSSISSEYKFDNKVDIPQPTGSYPPTKAYLAFTTKTGSLVYLVPNDTTNSSFTLKRRVNNEFL
jgi:hypothetical protein